MTAADIRLARQLREDEAFQFALAEKAAEAAARLRPRPHTASFCVLAAVMFGLWIGGLLFALSHNSWSFASVSDNPWIGVPAQALLDAHATCGPCISSENEWWRLFSSLLIPAGVTHVVLNSLIFLLASYVDAQLGLALHVYVPCLLVGAVGGSMLSAAAAQETVHAASSAVPAAALGLAVAGTVTWWRSMRRAWLTMVVLFLLLAVLLLLNLAPFADAWSVLGGAFLACLAGLVCHMPSYKVLRSMSERMVILWQVALGVFTAIMYIILVVSLLQSSDDGLRCTTCSKMSCVDMLGWSCAKAQHNRGTCDYVVFANATMAMECPSGATHRYPNYSLDQGATRSDLQTLCKDVCTTPSPSSGSAAAPASGGASLAVTPSADNLQR